MKSLNAADCVEQCREAGLEGCAAFYEGLYRAKTAAACPERVAPGGGGGDFLYDMIQLNVSYFAQFAKLGSAYSVYAARMLASVYGAYAPPSACAPMACPPATSGACKLVFEGAVGNTLTRSFMVRNDGSVEAAPKFTLEPLKGGSNSLPVEPTYLRGTVTAATLKIFPGDSVKIGMTVTFPNGSPKSYSGTLNVELGEKILTYPVTLTISG